jgi:hypothetical protein
MSDPMDPQNLEIEALSDDDLESVSGGLVAAGTTGGTCNTSAGTCNTSGGTCNTSGGACETTGGTCNQS